MFEKLIWKDDRVLLENLVFRMEHHLNENWELGERCLRFYKVKGLIDEYEYAFAKRPNWRPRHMLEIGMWHGGSLPFWFEILRPDKLVGLDLADRTDSAYFMEYISSRGLGDRIRTHWKTSQTDTGMLGRILESDFGGRLDLVMDDASHYYGPTKASFEYLFPRMPEGALYLIEDWAWSHWPEFQTPNHSWTWETPLTRLIFDLVEAIGTSTSLVKSLEVYQGFVIVERGSIPAAEVKDFKFENYISRRNEPNQGLRSAIRGLIEAVRAKF
jgi:hypothetical protein